MSRRAADDTTGLMLAFVREAAAQIRARLEELASATERALFDAFVAAPDAPTGAARPMNGELVIANAAAARLLEPEDHAGRLGAGRRRPRRHRRQRGSPWPAAPPCTPTSSRSPSAAARWAPSSASTTAPAGAAAGRDRAARVGGLVAGMAGARGRGDGGRPLGPRRPRRRGGRHRQAGRRPGDPRPRRSGRRARPGHRRGGATGTAWLDQLRAADRRPGTRGASATSTSCRPRRRRPSAAACDVAQAAVVATATSRGCRRRRAASSIASPAHLVVPPLGERVDDVPAVARELLRRHGDGAVGIRRDVVDVLARRPWPGNVRELEGVLRHALARRSKGDLTVDDLPVGYRSPARRPRSSRPCRPSSAMPSCAPSTPRTATGAAAAARLGISRSTLYRKLATYHLA